MGYRTEHRLAQFQAETGIVPAEGERLEALREMQQKCLDAILLIEREITGIRDGNGRWHGSNPIEGIAEDDLSGAIERAARAAA